MNAIRRLARRLAPTGALILSLDTIKESPKFFTVYAASLRAAGYLVVMLAERATKESVAREMIELQIPAEDVRLPEDAEEICSGRPQCEWKRRQVIEIMNEHAPVIYIDRCLGGWSAPLLPNSVVTLNWHRVVDSLDGGRRGELGIA